ncbi:MAG: MarR family winged helix-turn-helix transcriptional regulator [Brevibacterium sp.]|nr:MarR family winged helix-turn-helix transcriptional regulator [Brevibacterium sp.]
MNDQGRSDEGLGADDTSEQIAEALTRLQWRRGPGHDAAHRGQGRSDGIRRRHEGEHDRRGQFGGRAQRRLLIALAQTGRALGVSAIGESIGVDQPRASRLVSQGVALGLLEREGDPADARRTLIALTDQGRALSSRLQGAQRQSVDLALDGFTDAERRHLAQLLARLADAWPR